MGKRTTKVRRAFRRWFNIPLSSLLIQLPRMLAQLTYFALPLYLTYNATTAKIVGGKVVTEAKYSYDWPLLVLIGAYGLAGAYKFFGDRFSAHRQQRLFDLAASGSLKQLQEHSCSCPGSNSLDLIQQSILALIVDKTEQLVAETRKGVISANMMIADDALKSLSGMVFAREAANRKKIELKFGTTGAGRSIADLKTVYIPDIQDPDIKALFRDDAPYRSILTIPIGCNHRKLGVVNIDHVDPHALPEEIVAHLEPYVQMIGLSLCSKVIAGGS